MTSMNQFPNAQSILDNFDEFFDELAKKSAVDIESIAVDLAPSLYYRNNSLADQVFDDLSKNVNLLKK